ncbi:hypothetical protein F5Y00DRAFT_272692 [Daldinia vernicosa]|uniref:uncharacterized protein n=1 Tax=Daldinia vernicosa TaxID=114800 RepID=UPI0020089C61|nr:uncharacterized protein F5Y00DRAFT_272692 [Daldinia vernicosa]KAI0845787.1 hypothetical protein F5Y00DRAFT_272692 [Daldinia vernicosa]
MDPPDTPKYDPSKPGNLGAFAARYHEACRHHASNELLIRDLIQYNDSVETYFHQELNALEKKASDLQLDLNSSERTRRDLKQRLDEMETKLGYVPDRNLYVVVLIDGDGLIFKDNFVKKGIEGGKKAANELLKAINEKFNSAETTSVTVIVNIFANVTGLAKAMKRDGCVADKHALHDFVTGFNQANVSSTFVDVGFGKELADAKILDSLRFHLKNFNCKKAVLGVSHDAGYAPFLANMITDDTKERMALLEGTKTVVELVALGLQIFNVPRLFRHEKLSVKPQEQSQQVSPATSPSPSRSKPCRPPNVSSSAASWAAIARTMPSPPPRISLPIPSKATATPTRASRPPPAPWNPGPRGLDPPIRVDQVVLERLRKRKDCHRLCNNHFLRGPCTRGKECNFTHDYSPTEEEKKAIAIFARSNRCILGQECKTMDCIYGHHCPCVTDGICLHPHCKFRLDEHPPGTMFRGRRPKDDSEARSESYSYDGDAKDID